MIRFPLQLLAMPVLGPALLGSWIYSRWFMAAYLGAAMGAAVLIFRWVERPAR